MPDPASERLYRTPDDLAGTDPDRDIGQPGEFPFTRGVQPTMYRGRPWTMRQYAGFATAAESNARYRYLLSQGVMGLSVAFDLPTQIGYDSDHPLAAGEVGRVGVAIDSIEDMAALFEGIPLATVSTSMTINATAIVLLALYIAVAKRQGVDPRGLAGTVQNDILKEYIARGTYIYPPRASLRIVTDIIGYCAREVPQWNTISISGYHIREAGSTAVQEVAFTLANAIAYVEAGIAAGLDVDAFGQRLSFFFNAHNDFLEEVAKFRAARRLWARIMRDRFGATNPRAQQLRFHAQTAGSTLTAQQPDNNIVRVSLQALAAVLGGAQSLHCNGRDEALALPTEESATIALRTQQIILHESGVANTVDPVGGAYAIEEATTRIEQEAAALIERLDGMGGTLAAIEAGYVQRQIQDAAYRAQQAVDSGQAVVVGVNRYVGAAARGAEVFHIDPAIEREQIARVRAVRAGRSEHEWRTAIEEVERTARDGGNLVPPIVAAVERHATLGEIAGAMRGVFGEYQDVSGS
ncbi:MAG TPA: methylmalonyl-CoA mutase family protein [Vicinamibacterales bacterium]|nr:methylmalonyl-CoA mutase family protein [Vicinamibacterales bacterium]